MFADLGYKHLKLGLALLLAHYSIPDFSIKQYNDRKCLSAYREKAVTATGHTHTVL
jgi:hypothetical protein